MKDFLVISIVLIAAIMVTYFAVTERWEYRAVTHIDYCAPGFEG